MVDPVTNSPHTAHTQNPVPFILCDRTFHGTLRAGGALCDVAPTILEAARLPEPKSVNGTPQEPIQGVSMLYAVDDPKAAERHLTQYFEIAGNRAIYNDGWLAGTVHREPWQQKPSGTLQNDVWELYNTRGDFSLVNNLASKEPGKLKEMPRACPQMLVALDFHFDKPKQIVLAGKSDSLAIFRTPTPF